MNVTIFGYENNVYPVYVSKSFTLKFLIYYQ